jgi:hypothetical protein
MKMRSGLDGDRGADDGYFFFFGLPLACARSEAATVFASLGDFGSRRIFDATVATFRDVCFLFAMADSSDRRVARQPSLCEPFACHQATKFDEIERAVEDRDDQGGYPEESDLGPPSRGWAMSGSKIDSE